MFVDQPLQFARQRVHDRQPRGGKVTCLIGHRHHRLGLHTHKPQVAAGQQVHIRLPWQQSVHFQAAGAGARGCGPSEARLAGSGARHMDRGPHARCRELPRGPGEHVEILTGLERAGIHALERGLFRRGGFVRAGLGHMVHQPRRRGKLLRIRPHVADMPRQCVWGIAKHRVGVGLGRCGNGVCGSDQGLPSFQHAAQHKWRDQPLEEAGPGQEPVKRLGPDVQQVQHKRGVELLGEAGGRLGAVERG